MLAPDKTIAEHTLRLSISASAVITVYAGALRYAVSPLLQASMPGWFDPVKYSIVTAITNGIHWMDALCIDVTSVIPQSIISFAGTFDTASDTINNIETEIMMSSGTATPEQKQQSIDTLTTLKGAIAKANADIAAIDVRLLSLTKLMQADHDAFADAAGIVAHNIPDGGTISKEIHADLGNDFLTITPNGPCMVSLAIKSDVMIKITQTSRSHPELLPYVIAQKLIDNALVDNVQASEAISKVRATWSLMEGLVDAAMADVSAAADKDLLPILKRAEFSAARNVWDQLSNIAKTFM